MTHTDALATDTTYARLFREYMAAHSEADAAHDGALHHAYPADIADHKAVAVEHRYREARDAFVAYQKGI